MLFQIADQDFKETVGPVAQHILGGKSRLFLNLFLRRVDLIIGLLDIIPVDLAVGDDTY